MKGRSRQLKRPADQLLSLRCVKHGKARIDRDGQKDRIAGRTSFVNFSVPPLNRSYSLNGSLT